MIFQSVPVIWKLKKKNMYRAKKKLDTTRPIETRKQWFRKEQNKSIKRNEREAKA